MIASGRPGAALLMIDYQRAFCDADGSMARQGRDIGGLADALEVGNRVAAAARRRALPVIWTRMVFAQDYSDGGVLTREIRPNLARIGALRRGSGDETLSPACAYDESDVVIDKPRYSALIGTPLEVLLRARGRDDPDVRGKHGARPRSAGLCGHRSRGRLCRFRTGAARSFVGGDGVRLRADH